MKIEDFTLVKDLNNPQSYKYMVYERDKTFEIITKNGGKTFTAKVTNHSTSHYTRIQKDVTSINEALAFLDVSSNVDVLW